MVDSVTSNYDLVKPEISGSPDTWGVKLNQNMDKIDTALKALDTRLDAQESKAGTLPGTISLFGHSSVPEGWLKANGALVSRTTYAALYAKIGTAFGVGDGSTTFKLPDLRGEFIRGWDDGRGIDASRVFGSTQTDDLKGHTHTGSSGNAGVHNHTGSTSIHGHSHGGTTSTDGNHYHNWELVVGNGDRVGANRQSNATGSGAYVDTGLSGNHSHSFTTSWNDHNHTLNVNNNGDHSHSVTINSTGGVETRSRNVALLYCIKY